MPLAQTIATNDLVFGADPAETILLLEDLNSGPYSVKGIVRFSSSVPENCMTLLFAAVPASTVLSIHLQHQTGANLDRSVYTYDDLSIDGYQPQGVETADKIYVQAFSGIVTMAESGDFQVRAVACTPNGVITVHPASFVQLDELAEVI